MGVRVRETKPEMRIATGNGYSEFVEEPPEDPAHEKDRDENGHQRQGHGKDGEADLPWTHRGPPPSTPFAMLHVPDDVFQHHYGVVNHETYGEGERHERDVVNAEIHQIHGRKGAYDRKGERKAWDQGGGEVAEEEEDNQDHEADGKDHGELHVGNRVASETER